MYGNTPFGTGSTADLTPEQRRSLRRDLATVAARTRELLTGEYIVGSELARGVDGPRATVAVRPPVGSVVTADYDFDGEISDDQRRELARGLAASAALQVKQAMPDDPTPTAQ